MIKKVDHDKTNTFLMYNHILYFYQSRFRSFHSKKLCFSYVAHKIIKKNHEDLLIGMVLTDLQKAYTNNQKRVR